MIFDSKIIEDVVKEQIGEGRDELKIYKEAYDFSITCLKNKESQEIIEFNKQISDGIHGLSTRDSWNNLDNVAKHALTACVSVIENGGDDSLKDLILEVLKFKLTILNMGYVEFIEHLTKEAKEEFFPVRTDKNFLTRLEE